MRKVIFILAALLLISAETYAGIYGILKGTVKDDEGKAIIGATVRVEGTTRGTYVKQKDGSFTIVNIPAGTYNIKVTSVGFNEYNKKVKIAADTITKITVELTTSTVITEEICVCADKVKPGNTDAVGKIQNIGSEEITSTVGTSVNSVIGFTSGAVTGANGISIRGARCSETQIRVDGVDISNQYIGTSSYAKPVSTKTEKFNTENYNAIIENEFKETLSSPLSTFAIDVDAASYSMVRRSINEDRLPPKGAVRIEELINYFNYNYPRPADGGLPFTINSEYGKCPWNEKHGLLMIGLQGYEIPTEKLPATNLVFLVDVSGSMQYFDKLPLLKKSLRLLTTKLRPIDKVSIVVYAGAAGLVLEPTSGTDKMKIDKAIEDLEAGGSTNGAGGIKLAYEIAEKNFIKDGVNRVILATDGDFNVGVSSEDGLYELIKKERKKGVFLTVLGFGSGNYQDAKMELLADKGNGNYAYIDNINEAQKALVNEMGATLATIAKDVKIQIEFNPLKVKGYRLIGYENRMLQNEDFDDDKKDAGEIGAGHNVTAFYEIIPAGSDEKVKTTGKLKYQENTITARAAKSNELVTVKIRYKAPDGDESKLISNTVADNMVNINSCSENYRFAASVAAWGMLLRESEFISNYNYSDIEKLASSAAGSDANGYRKEFIDLVKKTNTIFGLQANSNKN